MGIPLNLDWQQILLHLLNFVILFAILYFLLYKPVKNFMDKRKKAYEDVDRQTNEDREEAEKLLTEYKEKLAGADAEIADKRKAVLDEANLRADEIKDSARKEAEEILVKAEQQAQSNRDRIVAVAGDEVTRMAREAAEKAIFGSTEDAYEAFLDKAEEKDQ